MTRPLSCFCEQCLQEDYENCQNKGHTKGNFTERELKSNRKNGQSNSTNENVEDESVSDDDMILQNEIRVEKQKIKFSSLKVNDIIIVPVGNDQIQFQPAQITRLEDIKNIFIDYLVPKYDNPEILVKSSSEDYNNYVIPLHDVVMKLPDPIKQRRGRIIFREKIILKD